MILYSFLFFLGLIVTFLVIPRIISVVIYKEIMDEPNFRSSHTSNTPSLGGIAFFISLGLGSFFIYYFFKSEDIFYLFPGLILLFIVGIKDDLVVLGPLSKFLAQICAISLLCLNPEFNKYELHGFLSADHLSIFTSIVLSLFIGLLVINSLNFVDGIDGLAGFMALCFFAGIAYISHKISDPILLGFALLNIGITLGFLPYNLSNTKKIFMGDTGSLILGFAISICIIILMNKSTAELSGLKVFAKNKLFLLIGLFYIPLFDTSRVFFIRLSQVTSPFRPDRNHIHHLLLDKKGFSHLKASLVLTILTILIFTITLVAANYFDMFLMFALHLIIYACLLYYFWKLSRKKTIV